MTKVTLSQMCFCAWLIVSQAAFVSTLALPAPLVDQSSQSLAVPRGAKETLVIEGSALRLQAHIWRNFMPGAVEAKPRGVIADIAVLGANGVRVPTTLHADTVWFTQRGRVWRVDKVEEIEHPVEDSMALNFVVRNGPEWPIKSFVDVVLSVADQHGRHYLFVLRHQIITMAI
jgi:hypothetical protein